MRDLVSCFSENAVNIAHPSCSSYTNASFLSPSQTPSIQNTVTSFYRIPLSLSPQKLLIISVTWFRTQTAQGLTINFGDPPSAIAFKLDTTPRIFRKNKGSKSYHLHSSKIELFWDLSNAKYTSSPEPISGFHVLVLIDEEIALVLGDISEEPPPGTFPATSPAKTPARRSFLVSRREHCSGNSTLYCTTAKFSENGVVHEILIRCSGENGLSVCIDKKTVIKVKRLQWNFRGNQTIFVDGLLVDLLWDVHDWFFSSSSSSSNGFAVFMFRTRSGLDSRLWLEEKTAMKEHDQTLEFSLLIYASKTS